MSSISVKVDRDSLNISDKIMGIIEDNLVQIVQDIAQEGATAAQAAVSTGMYAGVCRFSVEDIKSSKTHASCNMVGTGEPVERTWRYQGSTKTVQVDPLLMSEFGSGWLADNLWDMGGVGQGTFPGQKHASDPDGWYWTDVTGVEHHSIGEPPSYPMHTADLRMIEVAPEIAKGVFR